MMMTGKRERSFIQSENNIPGIGRYLGTRNLGMSLCQSAISYQLSNAPKNLNGSET